MHNALVLVPLLVLGWTGTLDGIPVLAEPLYLTQENFNVTRFLGKWLDLAVVSSCPHMQRHSADAAIGKLVLESVTAEDKLNMTRSVLSNGTCKQMSVEYKLTSTPGRFSYHVAKWGADVDAYVVHTNYDEYAIVIMKKKKSSETCTSLKLYSRTMAVRPTVLVDFRRLVREQGMSDDTVVIKQDKGDCVPGVEVEATPAQQQHARRYLPTKVTAEVYGSGAGDGDGDTLFFKGTEACKAAPETGPCFGLYERYYYNASSMSCHLFNYGGCLGNQNSFASEKDCLQRCRTEAVCRLPMAAQPCTGQPPVWAFDSHSGLCVLYKKDFCQANANKFYSKGECQEYCGVTGIDADLLA